jgi:hypothetical protein
MPKEEAGLNRWSDSASSEFFNVLREMGTEWMARARSEVELGLKLSKNLSAAHSVPDAITAYQEWLTEEMGARAEDARLLMSNGQKFIDTSSRLLANAWTSGSTTT